MNNYFLIIIVFITLISASVVNIFKKIANVITTLVEINIKNKKIKYINCIYIINKLYDIQLNILYICYYYTYRYIKLYVGYMYMYSKQIN